MSYSEIKQSVSGGNTITDSTTGKPPEPVYEMIATDPKPDFGDVKMDANPAYQATFVKGRK